MTSKKEELEKEKTALLATVREQSKDLQAKKEKLETELGKLKKKVDETKTEVNIFLLFTFFLQFFCSLI